MTSEEEKESAEARQLKLQEELCRGYNMAPDRAKKIMHAQKLGFLAAYSMVGGIKEYDSGERSNFLLGAVTVLSAYLRRECAGARVRTLDGGDSAEHALQNAIRISEKIAKEIKDGNR